MKKSVIYCLIFVFFANFIYSDDIFVSKVVFRSFEKTNEERIQKNLKALEVIEKSRGEESFKNSDFISMTKISEAEIYEPLKSVEVESENFKNVKKVLASIQNEKSDFNKIDLDKTEKGIRLTIKNLQFKSDSSDLLKSEKNRLNEIAKVLKSVSNAKFLIEGHTAKVGDEKGELKLSEERAKKIANELSKRGVSRKSFVCKGVGGSKPIASNETKEGRALNRRVEITILD